MEDLKPCPFCGEKEDIAIRKRTHKGEPKSINGSIYYFIECLPCDAKTGHNFNNDANLFGLKDGKEMAILSWNTRRLPKEVG